MDRSDEMTAEERRYRGLLRAALHRAAAEEQGR